MADVGWVLVRNADAGSDDADHVATVAAALDGADVVETSGPDDVDAALRDAGGRVVVACGGDGSISLLVERARALDLLDDVVFGLVPLGTGNDLAGHLGIPEDVDGAIRVLRTGTVHALDLLVVDDGAEVVVNAVHIGVGVDAAQQAEDLKDTFGALAYPLGAVVAGVSADGLDVVVEVDGERVDSGEPALMVMVGNAPTFGGGAPGVPAARPDDGLLDVVVSHALGPAARVAFAAALARGTHVAREDVVTACGREVVVRGEGLRHNADGELATTGTSERRYRVEPGAWRLVVPTDA